ncbi:MAG TPA: SAM-dependent chlorinase/fluorinase [Solirubrobacteraceae bacterium]|nr:SAM-dependent chlorinase/fluorinase [Solirubrobacteraceae bacterium]
MSASVITFLSDYGLDDDFVGICHGVIASICPDARVIDITHGVARHDVRAGAIMLRGALPFMPAGIHLAVVDPEVGAERRAVAVGLEDGRILVGPDNGLLSLAAEAHGGVVEAADIARSPYRLEPLSATFHGRDIFAPVAARLAAGAALAEIGDPCDPESLVVITLPLPRRDGDAFVARAISIDRFGNVQLNVAPEDLAGAGLKLGRGVRIEIGGGAADALFVRTFADVSEGGLLVYEDSRRKLAIAVSKGDAAARLGLAVDDELRLRAA